MCILFLPGKSITYHMLMATVYWLGLNIKNDLVIAMIDLIPMLLLH